MNIRRLARLVAGPPPPRALVLPGVNPLADDEARNDLRNAALSLTDPDVHAYLLLTVHQTFESGVPQAEVHVSGDGVPAYWPALAETLERILCAGR